MTPFPNAYGSRSFRIRLLSALTQKKKEESVAHVSIVE